MSNPAVQRAVEGDGGVRNFARLSPHVLALLEKQLPKPILEPGKNDPQYAAFCLGVQHVLQKLREGFAA